MDDIPIHFELDASDAEPLFDRLTSASLQQKILLAAGNSIRKRVSAGFRAKTSPYGAVWPPLKFRKGNPLRKTGALYKSIYSNIEGESVSVGTDQAVTYKGGPRSLGDIQHFGRTIKPIPPNKYLRVPVKVRGKIIFKFLRKAVIPPRPFLPIRPNGTADIPKDWQDQMLAAVYKAVRK